MNLLAVAIIVVLVIDAAILFYVYRNWEAALRDFHVQRTIRRFRKEMKVLDKKVPFA